MLDFSFHGWVSSELLALRGRAGNYRDDKVFINLNDFIEPGDPVTFVASTVVQRHDSFLISRLETRCVVEVIPGHVAGVGTFEDAHSFISDLYSQCSQALGVLESLRREPEPPPAPEITPAQAVAVLSRYIG